VGVTAVWGLTFTVVRDAVARYDVLGFLAIRFALAALILGPIGLPRLTRSGWRAAVLVGVALAGGYLLQTYGLKATTPTLSGLVTGLFVVFAPLCNRVLFGVRLSGRCWVAAGLSLLGLGLLTGAGVVPPNWGDALTLGCALCFGLHIALLDRTAHRHDTTGLAAGQLLTATVIFTMAWLASGHPTMPPREVWPAIAICGVVASALAFLVQTTAQRELPAIEIALILSLEPAFAVLFGWVLAGDRLIALQWLGAGLMLAALTWVSLPRAKAREGVVPAEGEGLS
jgi:drug/metabolite transporter (DMT)-like permease